MKIWDQQLMFLILKDNELNTYGAQRKMFKKIKIFINKDLLDKEWIFIEI